MADSGTVSIKAGGKILTADKGSVLMDVFRKNGIGIDAYCGGRGFCGKCAVRFISGAPEPSSEDRRVFTLDQLEKGSRLACRARLFSDAEVETGFREGFEILESYEGESGGDISDSSYVLGIDIGTTTVVMQLAGAESRKARAVRSFLNPQRIYGSDVISRISAAAAGKGGEMRTLITEKLASGYSSIKEELGISDGMVRKACVAANTTMLHLLLGYPAQGLGTYPFRPHSLKYEERDLGTVLDGTPNGVVLSVLPGMSAFVGADITAGLVLAGLDEPPAPSLFIDLGTNGEIAVSDGNGILVSSTAAGPAFEGGNISCGTGTVPGAIFKAVYQDGSFITETIRNAPVSGICGTGIIDIMSELVKNGLCDETGRLDGRFHEKGVHLGGDVYFTQKDIREIQLAKSAVCAGLLTLMKKKGLKADDIGALYIAGGFGTKIDIGNAADIGLIPKGLEDRTVVMGNSSLGGAMEFLFTGDRDRFIRTAAGAEEITLSTDDDFSEYYMDCMFFERL